MNRTFRLNIFAMLAIFGFISVAPVYAHEPIEGIGPHTLFRGGYSVETEVEIQKGERAEAGLLVGYGITSEKTIQLMLPNINRKSISEKPFGFRFKNRFSRKDVLGVQKSAAWVAGARFSNSDSEPDSYLFALTAGKEALRSYFFADAAYVANSGKGGVDFGDTFKFDVAFGVRPKPRIAYYKPDLVLLAELNAAHIYPSRKSGVRLATGGDILYITPGALYSRRNIMYKLGVKIPVLDNLRGAGNARTEFIFAIDTHL